MQDAGTNKEMGLLHPRAYALFFHLYYKKASVLTPFPPVISKGRQTVRCSCIINHLHACELAFYFEDRGTLFY